MIKASEPPISINAKLPALQNLKSARLQAQDCNGSLPGNCIHAVQGIEVLSTGPVGWLLQPMPTKVVATYNYSDPECLTMPAGRSGKNFQIKNEYPRLTWF